MNHHIYIEIYKEIQPNTYSVLLKEVDKITKIRKQVLNQNQLTVSIINNVITRMCINT